MKQNNQGQIRKKKVHRQQNLITLLCLACITFAGGWSVYATKADKAVKTGNVVSANSSSENDVYSSSDTEKISSANDVYSSENEESSDKDSEISSDSESSDDSKTESSESEADSSESKADSNSEHPYSEPTDKEDDLSDAVFIGDSRTVGLRNSSTMPKADYYCAVGLHIDTVMTEKDITLDNGNPGTVIQAVAQKQYKRIYINFGTNELGWPYVNVFQEKYKELIEKLKEIQPNATIYAEGVLPFTASKDAEGGAVNNANAKKFSQAIKETAEQCGAKYLDCSKAVADENGYLPEDASTDGIHLNQEYCLYWQNYIIDNT